jgi:aminoglycoside phosphotransferase (APT) family kinase protein
MSTIGHPLSDLANLLVPYTVTAFSPERHHYRKEFHPDSRTPGLPTRSECVAWYKEISGWDPELELPWSIAFAMWRDSIIFQGIAGRYAVRQASSPVAKKVGEEMAPTAEMCWELIQRAKNSGKMRSSL